jgi:hypothetical protein
MWEYVAISHKVHVCILHTSAWCGHCNNDAVMFSWWHCLLVRVAQAPCAVGSKGQIGKVGWRILGPLGRWYLCVLLLDGDMVPHSPGRGFGPSEHRSCPPDCAPVARVAVGRGLAGGFSGAVGVCMGRVLLAWPWRQSWPAAFARWWGVFSLLTG